jgi:hypothetical protein
MKLKKAIEIIEKYLGAKNMAGDYICDIDDGVSSAWNRIRGEIQVHNFLLQEKEDILRYSKWDNIQ